MLVIIITACVTIFGFDSLRDRVEQTDFELLSSSWRTKSTIDAEEESTTEKLSVLSDSRPFPVIATTTIDSKVSVPDGGVILVSGKRFSRQQTLSTD